MFSITLICMGKLKEKFYTEAAAIFMAGFFDRHRRIWITEIIYNLFAIKTNDSPFTG